MSTKASRAVAFLAFASSVWAGSLSAQEATVTFGGQVRPRMERRTPMDGSWNSFTSMRVRAQLAAQLEQNARVFIQLQDVRLFGEESNTLGDYRADNFDLHQGFVELGSVPGVGGTLRIGRQEMAFAEQRLIGAVGWAQQGRSFDGIRYATPAGKALSIDFFGMMTRESASTAHDEDAALLGAFGTLQVGSGSLDLFGILDTNNEEDPTDEVTLGANWRATAGPISLRLEGSVQTGERGGQDVSAFMVGARVGGRISERATLTFWYDHLSGDDDPEDGETAVFNTLYATNHAFYGLADLFLNIPVHTGGLGLRDSAIKLSFTPEERTTVNIDFHDLRATEQRSLSTTSFARELDLTVRYRLSGAVAVQGGYSYAAVDDGLKELGRFSDDVQWMYLMLNSVF